MESIKKYIAEAIGTFVLVLFGCGTACAVGCDSQFGAGYLTTALAFGLVIVAMAYSIGNISGCHINPAVSIAMWVSKKLTLQDFCGYVISQIIGGIAGAAVIGVLFDTDCGYGANMVVSTSDGGIIKSLAIEVILTGEEMYVNADMEKIKQVIYNLLDNAIKFSHHDSIITIETTEKKNKIFVSVKDTGIGIPKDDLKLIWDRFYKSDLSRGKDKKGTGLGLSIVKEIINSHNENINVISTEGVGTEFVFTLPMSKKKNDEE